MLILNGNFVTHNQQHRKEFWAKICLLTKRWRNCCFLCGWPISSLNLDYLHIQHSLHLWRAPEAFACWLPTGMVCKVLSPRTAMGYKECRSGGPWIHFGQLGFFNIHQHRTAQGSFYILPPMKCCCCGQDLTLPPWAQRLNAIATKPP